MNLYLTGARSGSWRMVWFRARRATGDGRLMAVGVRLLVAVPLALVATPFPAVARSSAPTQCLLQPASLGGSSSDLAGFVGSNYQDQVPVGVNSVAESINRSSPPPG